MKRYHYNWLATHPTRSELWLKTALAEGFEIHHVDGHHNNDAPSNLVLIYGPDHASLHAKGLVIHPSTNTLKFLWYLSWLIGGIWLVCWGLST